MPLLLAILVILLVITPIFAFMAFAGLLRVERSMDPAVLQALTARIYEMERRLAQMEEAVSTGGPAQASPGAVAPETRHIEVLSALAPAISAPPPAPAAASPHQPRPPMPAVNAFAAPPLHASQAKSETPLDMETRIAGRWPPKRDWWCFARSQVAGIACFTETRARTRGNMILHER